MFIQDPGDTHDEVKWNFSEDDIPVFYVDNDPYPYKATSYENAIILSDIRQDIRNLCNNLKDFRHKWTRKTNNKEYIDGVNVFLDIHDEYYRDSSTLPEPFYSISLEGYPVSKYLLSEIPTDTGYSGLNKPKMRYEDLKECIIGKDKKIRALYRDIFLDLDAAKLKSLVIHELAHTGANHVTFRPDDHHEDFKWHEKLIKKFWDYD